MPHRVFTVTTPDHLKIRVQEWGNPRGPELLFIHPWSASHMSWFKQVRGLAADFHIVTYDLRGHGYSDKPDAPHYYQQAKPWADELHAVMEAGGLRKPVLIAASTGGRAINDYLVACGEDRVSGIVLAAATPAKPDPTFFGPARKVMPVMAGDNMADVIEATEQFVLSLSAKPLSREDASLVLAYMMLTPPYVRAHMIGRKPENYEAVVGALRIPALVLHGSEDNFLLTVGARHTAELIPHAKMVVFDGFGHAIYLEDSERFNRELAAFARSVQA